MQITQQWQVSLKMLGSILVDPNLAFLLWSTECYGREYMVKMLL